MEWLYQYFTMFSKKATLAKEFLVTMMMCETMLQEVGGSIFPEAVNVPTRWPNIPQYYQLSSILQTLAYEN